jgi:hypothetical protein
MAEIVSLSKARKARARTEKEATAQQNRILFGRSKAEKARDAAEKSFAEKLIAAHRRDPSEPEK